MNKLGFTRTCILLWSFNPGFGQISQDRPDLCGDKDQSVPVPPGIVVLTGSDPLAVVTVAANGSTRRLELPDSYSDEIQEVCPAVRSRLVVFGASEGSYRVHIIDHDRASLVDSFWAYDPVISPNHRWIASRDYYPPRGEVRTSEEYLLYDLTSDAKANRHISGPNTNLGWAVGWAMYPAFRGTAPIDLGDIPDADTHTWRSRTFFWAPDSQSLVFADSVGDKLSLVLVLTKNDKPQAYTYSVASADAGSGAGQAPPCLMLTQASITSASNGAPSVFATFDDSGGGCQARHMGLTFHDFQPATVETYEHRKLKEPRRIK